MKRPVPTVPPMERSWTCLLLRRRWRPSALPPSVSMGEGEAALLEAFSPSEDMMEMRGRGVLVEGQIKKHVHQIWGCRSCGGEEEREKDTEEGKTKERMKSESKGFYCRSYLWEAKTGLYLSVHHSAVLNMVPVESSSTQWIEVHTQWVKNDLDVSKPLQSSSTIASLWVVQRRVRLDVVDIVVIRWRQQLHHQRLNSFALPFTPVNKHC